MTLDPSRAARNREIMLAHGLDALVCRLPDNVLLLTGYWPTSSFTFAVLTQAGQTALIAPHTERPDLPGDAADDVRFYQSAVLTAPPPLTAIEAHLRDIVRRLGVERGKIGLEQDFEVVAAGHNGGDVLLPSTATRAAIAAAAPESTLADATPALDEARACKTAHELAMLRRAARVAGFGLAAFRALYEPGRREAEIAAGVEAAIRGRGIGFEGARHVRAWAQLMSGPDSALAYTLHPTTSARRVREGALGVLELGTCVDGYWSDLTRTLVAGTPSARQVEMYAAVDAAVDAALGGAHAGMPAGEVDALARGEIERRGFGDLFVHVTGHGLGFRYHEPHPLLRPGSTETIQPGMVSSVEPGLYLEGFGGMRLEQNVAFTETGVEVLSPFPAGIER